MSFTEMQPRAVKKWDKFKLLMWKNFLLVRRLKLNTFLEITIPVIFSCLLVLIRSLADPDIYTEPFDYDALPLVNSSWPNMQRNFEWTVAYSPNNKILDGIMQEVKIGMNLTRIDGYETAEILNARLAAEANRPLAGIIFDECVNIYSTKLPKDLKYKLRFPAELRDLPPLLPANGALFNNWRTQYLYPPFAPGGPRNRNSSSGGRPPNYYGEKFSSLQSIISLAFINAQIGNATVAEEQMPIIQLQRFSYPPATIDILLEVLKVFVSLIFLLSFLYPCINNVKVSVLR